MTVDPNIDKWWHSPLVAETMAGIILTLLGGVFKLWLDLRDLKKIPRDKLTVNVNIKEKEKDQ